MRIENNVSLQSLNTFGVAATARHYARADSIDAVRAALAWAHERGLRVIILGGGSNILFTGDVNALVLHIALRGIDDRDMGGGKRLVTVAAGENWADLVWWAVGKGYGGIENLSLIPGTAGAAPVQNIGAYGAEFRDVCHSVAALDRHTGEMREFAAAECCFGYRDSVFKQQADRWIVTGVAMMLDRNAALRTEYGTIQEELAACGKGAACFADVANAVASIRKAKLPSPEELGNAGSFFKNPVVSAALYQDLLAKNPGMPGFAQGDGRVKLSAAWLLDTAGWKLKRVGDVGCCQSQPLVLVNYGGAAGQDILRFSEAIHDDIARRFGVRLEREAVTYP